ncbi:MAG TPA: hypothetical protein VIS72_03660 [Anaerolineales bacterium]
MTNEPKHKTDPSQLMIYQIRIEGHLDDQWADWFSDLSVTLEEYGDTLLTGPVVDQAALFGLLKKIRDLGMPLVSVNRVESCPGLGQESGKSVIQKGEMK